MTSSRKKLVSISIAFAFLAAPVINAPAQAETFGWASGPLTNLDLVGATVNGGFSKFPTKAGLYIQQCIAPIGSARPATCSDTIQVWVSASGAPGTTSPTGGIALKVASSITGKGVTVDCTMNQCGLFFRYDHTAPTDFSEDKFYPMTFAKGAAAPVLAADEITVTLNGKLLVRNMPSNLAYQADAKIVATAKSGAAITLTSLTPDCSYANGVLVALKGAGQCALAFATSASAITAAASGNFPFILVPGDQKILKVPATLKKGSPKALPLETNFGAPISYTSTSKNCQVEGNLVELKKSGLCTLKASAPAKEGMWSALSTTIKLRVK